MVDEGATHSERLPVLAKALAVDVAPAWRWEVYRHLQSLGIPCRYRTGEPLTVSFESPLAVVQYWCALRQLLGTRAESIDWLQACWQRSN